MRNLSKYSIKKQFIFILTVMILLSSILGIFAFINTKKQLEINAEEFAHNTSNHLYNEMEYLYKRVDTLFNSMLMDPNIERLMLTPYSSETLSYLSNLILQFTSYSIMNEDIVDISLYSDEVSWSSLYTGNELTVFSEDLKEVHQTKLLGLHHSSLHGTSSTSDYLLFGHEIYGMHDASIYGQYLGCIFISIDLPQSQLTLPTENQNEEAILLSDDKSDAAFSFIDNKIVKISSFADEISKAVIIDEQITLTKTENCFIYSIGIPDSSLALLCIINRYTQEYAIFQLTFFLILIILITIIILFLMMFILSQNMVNPLKILSSHLQILKDRVPGSEPPSIQLNGCSEIILISTTLNEMLLEQNRLTKELQETTITLYESQLEKTQAELDFLRSQINPHFLYNTLESIQDIAIEKKAPQIASIAGALGKLFRYNTKGNTIVTLEEELSITKAFLNIQQARFPDKLDILYSINADTLKLPTMKLILQPLVENAIVHGIEPKSQKCTLFLGSKRQGKNLILTIYDDGTGISEQQLKYLQHELNNVHRSSKTNAHIGMLNVQHRIRLQYGSDYGITVESTLGEGTRITIILPVTESDIPTDERSQE